mgnify:CR=1 FL=1
MAKRSAPEVNAGSMADIAFLLLIFFLVTTTIEVDSGISSKLPPDIPPPEVKIKQKNISEAALMVLKSDAIRKEKELNSSKFIEKFPNLDGHYIITVTMYNQKTKCYIRNIYNLDKNMKFISKKPHSKDHVKHILPLFAKIIKENEKQLIGK